MMRVWLLVMLTALLGAADTLAPTLLNWPAGRITLADGVARLTVGGNRVWLAETIDDQTEAEVPAVNGVWWDGVVALCQAFELCPDPGDPSEDHLDGPGALVPVGHGALVLTPGHPPTMQVAGALLAAIAYDGDIALWLRAEPRLPRGLLAWARADAASVDPATPEPLDSVELQPDDDRTAAIWRSSVALPAGSRFRTTVQVASIGRWSASTTLVVGADVTIDVQGHPFTVVLINDPAVTAWNEVPLPERRPLLAIAMPSDMAQGMQSRMRVGDTHLTLRNGGVRPAGDGRIIVLRYLRALPEGPPDLQLEGRLSQEPQRIDIQSPLQRSVGSPLSPMESPSRLSWDADTQPLSIWLQRLSATGNPVLPEVGVDTTAPCSVPAVHGGFWDGVLTVCRAADLAPALDPGSAIHGGAVRLIHRSLPPAAVSGPFLLLVRQIDRQADSLSITIGCMVEPRLQVDDFALPGISWASWAEDEDGVTHPLSAIQPANANPNGSNLDRSALLRRSGEDAPLQAHVRLTRGNARQITLGGMLFVPRIRLWRASTDLVPGQPAEVLLGDRAVEVTAVSSPIQIGNSQWGPGLILRGLAGAQSLRYAVAGSDGVAIEQSGEGNRMGGQLPGRPWLAWCRVPAEGRINVELAARAALAPLALPMRLVIPLVE